MMVPVPVARDLCIWVVATNLIQSISGLCPVLCSGCCSCGVRGGKRGEASRRIGLKESNLVDSASSHTLVSKTKPCKSKYKSFTLKLRMAHYISYSLFDSPLLLG